MTSYLRKVGVGVLSVVLLLTAGCSFFGAPKPNTLEPDVILGNAKTEIFDSIKASVKDSLSRYSGNYASLFTDLRNFGESEFKMNVDAGTNGKIELVLKSNSKLDTSKLSTIDMKSSFVDVIKAFKGESSYDLNVKMSGTPVGDVAGTVKFSVLYDGGVYFVRLDDAALENDIPGSMSKNDLEVAVSAYKGKLYKIDLASVIASNAQLMQILGQPLSGLGGLDVDKVELLISNFIDQVVMKDSWLEVVKDSKTKGDKGEVYQVVVKAEKVKTFLELSYDFLLNNLADVDAVFDITQSRNPFVATPLGTLEQLKAAMTENREASLSQISALVKGDLPLLATFAGDKLVSLSYKTEAAVKVNGAVSGSSFNFEIALNFDDYKNDIDNAYLSGSFDAAGGSDKPGNVSGTFVVAKPDGSVRDTDVTLEGSGLPNDLAFKGGLNLQINSEESTISKLNFDVDATFAEENGVAGVVANLNLKNGSSYKVSGMVQNKPDGKVLNMNFSGDFNKNDGDGKLEFAVNPEAGVTVKGDFGLNYNNKKDEFSYSLPAETATAEDFTSYLMQGLSAPEAAPDFGVVDGATPLGPEGGELTEEDIQRMIDQGTLENVAQ